MNNISNIIESTRETMALKSFKLQAICFSFFFCSGNINQTVNKFKVQKWKRKQVQNEIRNHSDMDDMNYCWCYLEDCENQNKMKSCSGFWLGDLYMQVKKHLLLLNIISVVIHSFILVRSFFSINGINSF